METGLATLLKKAVGKEIVFSVVPRRDGHWLFIAGFADYAPVYMQHRSGLVGPDGLSVGVFPPGEKPDPVALVVGAANNPRGLDVFTICSPPGPERRPLSESAGELGNLSWVRKH